MMPRRLLIFLALLGVAAASWRNAAKLACAGTFLSAVLNGVVDRFSGIIDYSWNSPPPPESWNRTLAPEELEAMNSAMRNLSAAQAQGYDAFVANYNFTKKTVELALRGQLPTEREDCSNPDAVPLQAPTTAPTRTPTGAPARRRHVRRRLAPASLPLASVTRLTCYMRTGSRG